MTNCLYNTVDLCQIVFTIVYFLVTLSLQACNFISNCLYSPANAVQSVLTLLFLNVELPLYSPVTPCQIVFTIL